jgi:hypothetical protein
LKFEDKLESEIVIVPFEGLILMKLIGSSDPESKAFSKKYYIGVLEVIPLRHT